MTLALADKLGPYEIQAPLGAGGMGVVYRARATRLERAVAIKVLPESLALDADRLRRFEQEARTVAALNHPNILAVYDIGQHQGSPYMVSELLEGETLREKMQEGPLSQRRAIEYASQIAEGLAAAHDKGVVHRDLKPENVFVTKDGRVKILDFGLAKLAITKSASAGAGDGATLTVPANTMPGMVLGTAGYMSPEQVRGKEVDARTDIFALVPCTAAWWPLPTALRQPTGTGAGCTLSISQTGCDEGSIFLLTTLAGRRCPALVGNFRLLTGFMFLVATPLRSFLLEGDRCTLRHVLRHRAAGLSWRSSFC